jgi:AraC-like DNA-binding protein
MGEMALTPNNVGGVVANRRPATPPAPANPPNPFEGGQNTILSATSKRHHVPGFAGGLSVKSVLAGTAAWEADGRRFVLHENCHLILNDRQIYTITVDSIEPVSTFCIFFQCGFVEDIFRSTINSSALLLDSPQPANRVQVGFLPKIEPGANSVSTALDALRRKKESGKTSILGMEEGFTKLAVEMVREYQRTDQAIARLPALRQSTREELYRRVLRGQDFMLSSLDGHARLATMARAACMSPFHFHRVFTNIFGETPHRYLTRIRLKRAAHLLSHSNKSVTEICLETGFESLGSFSSLFRRHFGFPPSDLRTARHKSKIQEALIAVGA